jgi:hypothetical protein
MFTDLFWKISALLFLFLNFTNLASALEIRGMIFERGTSKPMVGVRIFLLPLKKSAETNSQGEFQITLDDSDQEALKGEEALSWVVNSMGYKKIEVPSTKKLLTSSSPLVFRLEREVYGAVLETTVTDKNVPRDPTRKSLSQREFLQIPGSGGDPVKAAQNLPGVNRAPGFSSFVVIQGSEPEDTIYTLEGHEIPLMFHAGGFYSIGFPEAVEGVDILTAGYAADSGRALGGHLNLRFRDLSKATRLSGVGYVDLLNAGALIETKVGENGAFLLAGRQSYIGFILKAVLPDSDAFDLTVAPSFQDLLGIYEYKFNSKLRLRLTGIFSNDIVEFLIERPVDADPSIRGEFKTQTQFYRFIPGIKYRINETTELSFSTAFGEDEVSFRGNTNRFLLDIKALTTRGEISKTWSDLQKTRWGFDNKYSGTDFDISLTPAQGGGNSNSTEQISIGGYSEQRELGLYVTHEAKIQSFVFEPSLRFDAFRPSAENYFSPRGTLRYRWSSIQNTRLSGGQYYQPPLPQETSPEFGNPSLKSSKSRSVALGHEIDLREGSSFGWIVDNEIFYKWLYSLSVEATDSQRYTNGGLGNSTGWQLSVKYQTSVLDLGLNYTLSLSRRWQEGDTRKFPSAFDQTHNLGLIGGIEVAGNWRFSTRFRYVTGNPYTPVVSAIFDSDQDSFIPVEGEKFSRRLKGFSQLDFRVDKRVIFDSWTLSFYLDLQNLLNRKNEEQINYSYNYSQSSPITGLPIIGTLGVKGEF